METTISNPADKTSIKDAILNGLTKESFHDSKQLIEYVQNKSSYNIEEIMSVLIMLENEGKIHFEPHENKTASYIAFIFTRQAAWYWMVVTFTILTVTTVLLFPSNLFMVENVRIIFGGVFLAFMPGYTLIRLLFPIAHVANPDVKGLDVFERFALSLGLSLVLAPMAGLVLNYTPWGIALIPITLILTMLTLFFATAATNREYRITNSSRSSLTENSKILHCH
jgi:uncharacterized membrane protein